MAAWLWSTLAAATVPSSARADIDARAERARIAAERTAVEQRYTATQADCARRFIVTTCANDAKRQRRTAIEALNRQTLAIDESERRRQAASRLRTIDAKAAAHAARQASGAAATASEAPSPAAVIPRSSADPASSPRVGIGRESGAIAQEAKARDAALRVVEREERRRQADEHRAAVERRLRERRASGRAATPLPQPPSGSSP